MARRDGRMTSRWFEVLASVCFSRLLFLSKCLVLVLATPSLSPNLIYWATLRMTVDVMASSYVDERQKSDFAERERAKREGPMSTSYDLVSSEVEEDRVVTRSESRSDKRRSTATKGSRESRYS